MIADIDFLHEDLMWPVFAGSLVLLVVYIWKEWPPIPKKRFYIKCLAAILLILSLAMIALRPLKERAAENKVVALVSEGMQPGQLDSLDKVYPDLAVLKYKVNEDIRDTLNSYGTIVLLGRGIQPFDFWQLEGIPVRYLGGEQPQGIIQLWYDWETSVGKELSINGTFNEPSEGDRLVLKGPGGTGLDSVHLDESGLKQFQLHTIPAVPGKFLFSLDQVDSMGALKHSEPLPISVASKKKLKIGVVNDYPTFETKYLKNFLAEMGHELLIRSKVSSDRFKMEAFNTDPASSLRITEMNLETFDLLIMDSETYSRLPVSWRTALIKAITHAGLGLFIQPGTGFFDSTGTFVQFEFLSDKTTQVQPEQVAVDVPKHPFHFKKSFGLQAVHAANGKVLTAYVRAGEGRIGSMVFENTFQLLLDGHQREYQQLWTVILNGISRKHHPVAEWNPGPRFIYRDYPFKFEVRTNLDQPEVISSAGYVVPLAQDIDLSNLWRGTTYPRHTGWNHQNLKNDTTSLFEYYVMDTTNWRALSAYDLQDANNRHWAGTPLIGDVKKKAKPLPLTVFYLVFLLCSGYLWLEPKLFQV